MPAERFSANYQRMAALGLLLLTLLGLYILVDRLIVDKYQYYRTHVEQLRDRLQRLNGMLATRQTLEAQIQQINQDNSVDAFYMKSASPTLAATELQQLVRGTVEGKGGNLVSTQILPVKTEGSFSRVAIKVQMTGNTEALQQVLYELESARPLLFIGNLQIRARPVRQPRSQRRRRSKQKPPSPPPVKRVLLTTHFELAGYMRVQGTSDDT